MNILIHACPKRSRYVYGTLIPALLEQGIKEDEIHVWMDHDKQGNLKSCIQSFRACGIWPGGTWHLQDDVYPSKRFAELARAHDEGVVCGFCNEDFGPDILKKGLQPPDLAWNSFQCIRIPNKLAEEFVRWFLTVETNRPGRIRTYINENKYDDWFWQQFIIERHQDDLRILNLTPNMVDHVDYLIGGSVINELRIKKIYRAYYWEDGEPEITTF